jgi:hypothetical protein
VSTSEAGGEATAAPAVLAALMIKSNIIDDAATSDATSRIPGLGIPSLSIPVSSASPVGG